MIVRLHTRVSVAIIGLIAVLVVVLSGILFVQFRETMEETRRSNSDAMAAALLRQAEKRALGLASFLSEALVNPLLQDRWDVVRDLAESARDQRGVEYVRVFDTARNAVPTEAAATRDDGPPSMARRAASSRPARRSSRSLAIVFASRCRSRRRRGFSAR